MKIDVFSLDMAQRHVPKVPTIALRLFGKGGPSLREAKHYPLKDSPLYVAVFAYAFDYLNIRSEAEADEYRKYGYTVFSSKIAEKIMFDFRSVYEPGKNQGLLVNCWIGIHRAPAVAIALNDIFKLGDEKLRQDFPRYNQYIYKVMMKSAAENKNRF